MPQMPESAASPAAAPAAAPIKPVARLLPPEEWAERVPALAMLPPASSFVVVVEDGGPGGRLLAQWAAMTVTHVEGLELAADVTAHAGVGRALLTLMVQQLRAFGVREVLTQADTPEVGILCAKAGGHAVPGATWVIPIGEEGS